MLKAGIFILALLVTANCDLINKVQKIKKVNKPWQEKGVRLNGYISCNDCVCNLDTCKSLTNCDCECTRCEMKHPHYFRRTIE